MTKFMYVIQPEGCATPMQPVGPSLIKCSLKLTLGKTNIGGTVFANAFTANSTVTNCPLSPDVRAPICFAPLRAMTFEGHCSVVTPINLLCRLMLGMHNEQSLQMVYQIYGGCVETSSPC